MGKDGTPRGSLALKGIDKQNEGHHGQVRLWQRIEVGLTIVKSGGDFGHNNVEVKVILVETT